MPYLGPFFAIMDARFRWSGTPAGCCSISIVHECGLIQRNDCWNRGRIRIWLRSGSVRPGDLTDYAGQSGSAIALPVPWRWPSSWGIIGSMAFRLLANLLRKLALREEPSLRGMFSDPDPLVPHGDEYPDVPPPEDCRSLIFFAARWASHDLYGEDMPGVAADLLELGYDSPSLRRLAGETEIHNSADAEPLVSKMFFELGVTHPLPERAARLITSCQIAREVIAGLRNPWSAASALGVMWRWDSDIAEVQDIDSILDEVDWSAEYRRSSSDLNQALLSAFARLATVKIPEH
jgi:hypothetical protein